jgi:hypothetical protein
MKPCGLIKIRRNSSTPDKILQLFIWRNSIKDYTTVFWSEIVIRSLI